MKDLATSAIGVSKANDLATYTTLLDKFRVLPKLRNLPTFMEIAGYGENVCSNILAFFFDPEKEHGLGDLLLKAFLKCLPLREQQVDISAVKVRRECSFERKRLDILITTNSFILGIENKIDHWLANPLDIYDEGIQKCTGGDRTQFKVVLGLREITEYDQKKKMKDNGFQSVTYTQLFAQLKPLIGHYSTKADVRYLTYLNDFIKTIESRMNTNSEDQKTVKFFQEHGSDIEALGKQYQTYKDRQFQELWRNLEQVVKSQSADAPIKVAARIYNSSAVLFSVSNQDITIWIQTEWDNGRWRSRIHDKTKTRESLARLCSVFEVLDRDTATKLEDRIVNAANYFSPGSASIEAVAENVKNLLRKIAECLSVPEGGPAAV